MPFLLGESLEELELSDELGESSEEPVESPDELESSELLESSEELDGSLVEPRLLACCCEGCAVTVVCRRAMSTGKQRPMLRGAFCFRRRSLSLFNVATFNNRRSSVSADFWRVRGGSCTEADDIFLFLVVAQGTGRNSRTERCEAPDGTHSSRMTAV
jgi:hypothetical protein